MRETGKPIAQIAKDLGINEGTLGNWVAKDRQVRGGDGRLSEDERAELARLRKENAELAMERDVLKRSVARSGWRTIVHRALLASPAAGCVLMNRTSGQTTVIAGASIRGGPLDNAAWLHTIDPRDNTPTGSYIVPIEVKNVRHWLYSGDVEVHQLLYKAAALQRDLPERAVVPVLVCRQAQHVTMTLAQKLGFQVINTKRQAIAPNLDSTRLAEVREELGYDIVPLTDPDPALIRHFSQVLQAEASARAERWSTLGSTLIEIYAQLREPELARLAVTFSVRS